MRSRAVAEGRELRLENITLLLLVVERRILVEDAIVAFHNALLQERVLCAKISVLIDPRRMGRGGAPLGIGVRKATWRAALPADDASSGPSASPARTPCGSNGPPGGNGWEPSGGAAAVAEAEAETG